MSKAEDLINDARNYASDQLQNAYKVMGNAMDLLNAMHAQGAGKLDYLIVPPEPIKPQQVPQFSGTGFKDPGFNAEEPHLEDVGNLDLSGAPPPPPPLAHYNPPPQPQGEPQDTTGNGPPINMVASVPPPPDLMAQIASIPVPKLIPITFPEPPTYTPPEFVGQPITPPPPPPTGLGDILRDEYTNISPIMVDAITAQLDAFLDREFPQFRPGMAKLEARLDTYLNGGSALSPEIENAIYNRTLDKTNNESVRAGRKAWNEAGRMGFTMPSPILVAQQYDIDQARRDTNARAAIDIAVKQAELEQQNLQFAVTQSSMLRKLAIDSGLAYYSGLVQINGQSLEYARALVDSIVKVYELAAKYSEIQARICEAYVRIYEAQLQGAMATIQAYTAHVNALVAKSNIDLAQVQLYTAQIGAVETEATVYRAYVDGIKAQAEIEKMKVEIYTAEVGAYVSKMNGFTARWQGYSAAVGGESAKMQASGVEQQAWASRGSVYEATIRGRTAALQGKLQANEGQIKAYQVAAEAYGSHVRALAEVAHAEVESFNTTIQAFTAEANALSAYSHAQVEAYMAGLRAADIASTILLANLAEANKIEMQKVTGMSQVATSAGSIFAGVAQATLSGMNSLASVSTEEDA